MFSKTYIIELSGYDHYLMFIPILRITTRNLSTDLSKMNELAIDIVKNEKYAHLNQIQVRYHETV